MREHRRRFVSLACMFVVALAAAAVGVGAGAAAPARAAQPPLSLWWTTFNGSPETECWIDSAKAPDGSLFAGGFENWNSLGGGGDLLVAKFDGNDTAADHQIWQRTWDNPDAHSSDEAAAIAVDRSGAVFLYNANIPEYLQANRFNHEPRRPRKLLLHAKEIVKLARGVEREGMTIVPLRIYFNAKGRAKVAIALARGKQLHDKREAEKTRDWNRDKSRLMRQRG